MLLQVPVHKCSSLSVLLTQQNTRKHYSAALSLPASSERVDHYCRGSTFRTESVKGMEISVEGGFIGWPAKEGTTGYGIGAPQAVFEVS
jgi:hypothetical protein